MTYHYKARSLMVAVFVAVLVARDGFAQPSSAETLTNDSVVLMVTGKVPKNLVLSKIESTASSFEINAKSLVALQQSKLPTDVIRAMMNATVQSLAGDSLDNEAVIYMVSNGLPKPLVLGMIQLCRPAFDTTAAGMVTLNQNKVPQDVLKTMMTAPNRSGPVSAAPSPVSATPSRPTPTTTVARGTQDAPAAKTDTSTPARNAPVVATTPKRTDTSAASAASTTPTPRSVSSPEILNAIYLVDPATGRLTLLERQTGSITGRGGFIRASQKVKLKGPHSPVRLSSGRRSEFMVRLAPGADPGKFLLYAFGSTDDGREVTLAKANGLTMTTRNGLGTISYDIAPIKDSTYKFVLVATAPSGEYGFSASDSQDVYLFGIGPVPPPEP